jgi:hypothetical protein
MIERNPTEGVLTFQVFTGRDFALAKEVFVYTFKKGQACLSTKRKFW